MPKLCIGLNKVALLRSARGGNVPELVSVASALCAGGCRAVLVHQWPDNRHVRPYDVLALAAMQEVRTTRLELNVGGDPRDEVVELVARARRVHTFVVTPFDAHHLTTQRGWTRADDQGRLRAIVAQLGPSTVVSVFCDPAAEGIELAAAAGATSVELNCRGFIEAFGGERQDAELRRLLSAAVAARACGLAVHAAHDLGLCQLRVLTEQVELDQVSVGHRFIAEAVVAGSVAILPDFLRAVGQAGITNAAPSSVQRVQRRPNESTAD